MNRRSVDVIKDDLEGSRSYTFASQRSIMLSMKEISSITGI